MPNRPMQIDPVFNDDGDYVGSQVHQHSSSSHVDHNGMVKNWESDYYEDSKGQIHHHFEDTVLEDERSSPTDFQMDSYQQALVESIPNLESAIRWVEQSPSFTEEELVAYNQALDNQDLDALHAFYERLMPLYYEALQESQEAPEEVSEDVEMSDEEVYETLEQEGVIDETIDYLIADDFELSEQQVDQLDTVAEVFSENTAEHQIANVGMSVARGDLTMDEAITIVTEQFGDVEAARAYFKLQSILG